MTMQAVVFHGPFDIRFESKPKPQLRDPTDAIVKVLSAGLCGSDLHMYRGHQSTATGHIMGHEFVGIVDEVGSGVKRFHPGEKVISIFAPYCMQCWYCKYGYSRCENSPPFGTQALDGGQAEYVRVPYADGTLQSAPEGVDDRLLILMCDIMPTGYYGAMRAVQHFQGGSSLRLNGVSTAHEEYATQDVSETVFVCLGCGPVGLCAIIAAISNGVKTIFAVDSIDERLEEAARMGAIPLKLGQDDIKRTVLDKTEGRGADAVLEVVGNKAALLLAYDLLRPCGVLSSVGFHQEEFPFTALQAYQKNVTMSSGRCPVRTVFRDSLQCLLQNKSKLDGFVSHKMPGREAAKAYELFEKYLARKVVLEF